MKEKLFVLLSFLAISCNDDKTIAITDETALNLVTGINFRQTQDPDEITVQYGNPNVLVNNKFKMYPNPANELVYISAQENVTDVWFVKANPEKIHQDVNFSSVLNENLYSEQSIISNSKFSLTGQSANSFGINVGTFAKGYYRVFVKIDGKIYSDNLYKIESQKNNEEQIASIINFWK